MPLQIVAAMLLGPAGQGTQQLLSDFQRMKTLTMNSVFHLKIFLLTKVSLCAILESPSSSVTSPGDPVTLRCRVSGDSENISWYKDKNILKMEELSQRLMLLPDGSLFILSALDQDSGSYQCSVYEEEKEVFSDIARLVVGEDAHNDALETPTGLHASLTVQGSILIEWNDISEADKYIIEVSLCDDIDCNNSITIESDKSNVLLHNIDESKQYEIKVASKNQFSVSYYSSPFRLFKQKSSLEKENTPIPPVLWVVAISVVGFMTVITIFGISFILIKMKTFKNINTYGKGENSDEPKIFNPRRSWSEQEWNSKLSSIHPFRTFYGERLTNSDSHYESSSHYMIPSHSSHSSNSSNSISTHYASSYIKSDDNAKQNLLPPVD